MVLNPERRRARFGAAFMEKMQPVHPADSRRARPPAAQAGKRPIADGTDPDGVPAGVPRQGDRVRRLLQDHDSQVARLP